MKKSDTLKMNLLSCLQTRKQMTIQEACDVLKASESTVRRLFSDFEKCGIGTRLHGAIRLSNTNDAPYIFDKQNQLNYQAKEIIGKLAATRVSDGDVIYIDWGTTTSHFCRALAERMANGSLHNVTVFTNSFVNLELLYRHCTVILLGGRYREARKDLAGFVAEEAVRSLHFHKCFICVDGYTKMNGFAQLDFDSARVDRIVFDNSDIAYVMMDNSKFHISATVSCKGNRQFDYLITDKAVDEALIDQVRTFTKEILTPVSDSSEMNYI